MNTSQAGLEFIESNEGVVLHVYKDVAGHDTWGIGHLVLSGEDFTGKTLEDAYALLKKDLIKVDMTLHALAPDNCTQNQWDALADFAFNMGIGALQTLLTHGWGEVTMQLPRWVYADHKEIHGLVLRRQREIDLFNTP